MEALQRPNILLHTGTEARKPIVILPLFLSKPTSGNNADAGVVQQSESVECIGLLTCFARCLDRGFGQPYPRVQVECAGRVDAGHAREGVEPRGHRFGAQSKRGVRRVGLLLPKRIARVSRARGAHHAVDADLPCDRGAEHDGDELVHERDDVVGDVRALKVAAAPAALAHDALGDRVEGDEGQGRAERAHDLLEGRERVRRA